MESLQCCDESVTGVNCSALRRNRSLGIGLLTAMDTLAAQAYGAKNFKRVGVVYQRAMLVLAFLILPVSTVLGVPCAAAWLPLARMALCISAVCITKALCDFTGVHAVVVHRAHSGRA